MNTRELDAVSDPCDVVVQQPQPPPQLLLEFAMRSLNGRADFALLRHIYEVAVDHFGFDGTLDEAARVLEQMTDVRLEHNQPLAESRVFARAYWTSSLESANSTRPESEIRPRQANDQGLAHPNVECRPRLAEQRTAVELIRWYFTVRPSASADLLSKWLEGFDIRLSTQVIESLLAAIRAG